MHERKFFRILANATRYVGISCDKRGSCDIVSYSPCLRNSFFITTHRTHKCSGSELFAGGRLTFASTSVEEFILVESSQRANHLRPATTGNVTWKMAPGRAFKTMKGATMPYPIHTQIQACHQDRPSWTMDDTIIHLNNPLNQSNNNKNASKNFVRVDIEAIGDPTTVADLAEPMFSE